MMPTTNVKGHWRKAYGKLVWVRPHERVIPWPRLKPGESTPIIMKSKRSDKAVKRIYRQRDEANMKLDGFLAAGEPLERIADRLSSAGLISFLEYTNWDDTYKMSLGIGDNLSVWYYHANPETYPIRRRKAIAKKFFYGKKNKFGKDRSDDFYQASGWLVRLLNLDKNRNSFISHRLVLDTLSNGATIGMRIPAMDKHGKMNLSQHFKEVGYGLRWGIRTGRVLTDAKGDLVWPRSRERMTNFEVIELLTRIGLTYDVNESSAGVIAAYANLVGLKR